MLTIILAATFKGTNKQFAKVLLFTLSIDSLLIICQL